jgi:hypothetical protein
MKLEFSRQIFEKSWNIKFHQNPSSGSRVVACGQTYMTKLIVAFRNLANAPNNKSIVPLNFLRLEYTVLYWEDEFWFLATRCHSGRVTQQHWSLCYCQCFLSIPPTVATRKKRTNKRVYFARSQTAHFHYVTLQCPSELVRGISCKEAQAVRRHAEQPDACNSSGTGCVDASETRHSHRWPNSEEPRQVVKCWWHRDGSAVNGNRWTEVSCLFTEWLWALFTEDMQVVHVERTMRTISEPWKCVPDVSTWMKVFRGNVILRTVDKYLKEPLFVK